MKAPYRDRSEAFLGLLAYLTFVVYGSLVPFELRPVSLEQAFKSFDSIQYLNLDAGARADWVANILLYIPLAFLGCNWLVGMRSASPLRHLSALVILGFCLAVAVGVEFTQIFFAPRTVSLNDLLAETLGSVLGLALFAMGRWRIAQLQDSFAQGGRESVIAAAVVYGLLYAVLSLFPYDFIISRGELTEKLSSINLGWFIAGDCGGFLRCSARQISEFAAIAPLGLLLAIFIQRLSYRKLFLAGALLGLILETSQLLLFSGVSQGISLFTRGAGLVAGAAIGRFLRQRGPAPVARIVRFLTPFLIPPYLYVLAAVSGWFSANWLSWHEATARLPEFRIMPFYYHYWTTETEAMVSLLSQAGMYSPVGIAWWGFCSKDPKKIRAAARWAALTATALALPIELGKLFLRSAHPDPTNLLIAAASAALFCALANWMGCVLVSGQSGRTIPSVSSVQLGEEYSSFGVQASKKASVWLSPPPAGLAIFTIAALMALAGAAQYPMGKLWLCAALLGYGAMLWKRPLLSFFIVPALLPLLDLSPFTGRLIFDEFDLAVLVSLAILYLRLYGMKPLPWPNRWLSTAVALLWTSWWVAFIRGIWPLFAMQNGIPESSHTPIEAWFVGKGLLWALLYIPILRRMPAEIGLPLQQRVLGGVLTGLVMVSLFVLWERHVFVGLGDFQNVFRVTGTFANMNTGGAYIETFIAFAFPILVAGVLMTSQWIVRILGLAATGIVSYAMMVTFSRGGYAGLVAGLLPLTLALRFRKGFSARQWLFLAGVLAASIAAAVPVLTGEFAKSRLSNAAGDLSIRWAHWAHALDLMDKGPASALMGMGFGRYPSVYALQGENARAPGSYIVLRDGDNPYLRLGSGESVFIDQIVAVEAGEIFKLSARIRQPFGDASLGVNLCRKSLLYSFECVGKSLEPERSGHLWRMVSVDVNAMALDAEGDWPYRTVKLSLGNPGSGGLIDVDDVSLKTGDGRELLSNGDFSHGAARWLFVADQDLAWHIHQQAVEMYFAQGLLGLAAMAVLLVGVGKILWPALRRGELSAAAMAGALLGFLTVGLLGSTMDTARLATLFYLGAFCAGLLTLADKRARKICKKEQGRHAHRDVSVKNPDNVYWKARW